MTTLESRLSNQSNNYGSFAAFTNSWLILKNPIGKAEYSLIIDSHQKFDGTNITCHAGITENLI